MTDDVAGLLDNIEELEELSAPNEGGDYLDGFKIGAALMAAIIAGIAAT